MTLTVVKLKEWGYFHFGSYTNGTVTWRRSTGEEAGSIGIATNIDGNSGVLDINYNWRRHVEDEKEELNYQITLTTTTCNYGSYRWWFICPLIRNGFNCGRRIGSLYLPPNSKYFGCRHCHDLTYESCKESHKFDSIFKMIGRDLDLSPKIVKERLKNL